jgi:hypothetical protein
LPEKDQYCDPRATVPLRRPRAPSIATVLACSKCQVFCPNKYAACANGPVSLPQVDLIRHAGQNNSLRFLISQTRIESTVTLARHLAAIEPMGQAHLARACHRTMLPQHHEHHGFGKLQSKATPARAIQSRILYLYGQPTPHERVLQRARAAAGSSTFNRMNGQVRFAMHRAPHPQLTEVLLVMVRLSLI